MRRILYATAAVLFISGAAPGQEMRSKIATTNDEISSRKIELNALQEAQFGLMGPVVKGAPYSATMTTQSTQTLADGTHINNKSSFTIFRDSDGRIRRVSADAVWIFDPVAGVSYFLNDKKQTATKSALGFLGAAQRAKVEALAHESRGSVMIQRTPGLPGSDAKSDSKESLGTKLFDGVPADGTLTTIVIPEGTIGNDKPVKITEERWYSSELQVIVMSRRNDPRAGETLFQLTNIQRNEPDPSLFQVPAGYTLREEPRR